MKKLQNNFTTTEQSKRLLALGLPKDSADCYYLRENPNRLCILNDGITISKLRLQLHMSHTMPCWSAGRLIEIYDITINLFPGMDLRLSDMIVGEHSESYVEKLVYLFERAAEDGMIDFKELEE